MKFSACIVLSSLATCALPAFSQVSNGPQVYQSTEAVVLPIDNDAYIERRKIEHMATEKRKAAEKVVKELTEVPVTSDAASAGSAPVVGVKKLTDEDREAAINVLRNKEKQIKHGAKEIERVRVYDKPASPSPSDNGTDIGKTPGDQLIDAPKPPVLE